MKTEIHLFGTDGDSVTGLAKPQANGKVSLSQLLNALGVAESEWNTTWLQITAVVINREELCASGS